MTEADYRVEALRLAVATVGEPNKVPQAQKYLDFILAGTASVPVPVVQQKKVK